VSSSSSVSNTAAAPPPFTGGIVEAAAIKKNFAVGAAPPYDNDADIASSSGNASGRITALKGNSVGIAGAGAAGGAAGAQEPYGMLKWRCRNDNHTSNKFYDQYHVYFTAVSGLSKYSFSMVSAESTTVRIVKVCDL
jgi:hypothetical protein